MTVTHMIFIVVSSVIPGCRKVIQKEKKKG